jgi:hypothetical protein
MPDDRPASESIPLADLAQEAGSILGPSGSLGLSDEEQTALLDIARIAAHTSERITAPLSRRRNVRQVTVIGSAVGGRVAPGGHAALG